MLVPVLGMGALAATVIDQRWDERQTSTQLAEQAEALGETIDLYAALSAEEVHLTVHALTLDLGGTPEDHDDLDHERIESARALIDQVRTASPRLPLADTLDALVPLRRAVEAGEGTYPDVDAAFRRVNAAIETRSQMQLTQIERIANQEPLAAEVRAHLRALRASLDAFPYAGDRVRAGLALVVTAAGSDAAADLIEISARFDQHVAGAQQDAGPRAALAWRTYESDPARQRAEATFDQAVRIGLGQATSPFTGALDSIVPAIEDGAAWVSLLSDAVTASAADLEATAQAQAANDSQAVQRQVLLLAVLVLVSVGLAVVLAREMVAPSIDLERAARRVARGEFDLPAIEERGPREVMTTVAAFNDMAATLAAVEDHAVALADDPDAPILGQPLPGRTGEALQITLDKLRASMRDAEQHRYELAEMAAHDDLTGLLNRGAAFDAIRRDLARARREHQVLLALYVDLDGLKILNDTYGHAVGDAAIRQTANALSATTREGDVVARLGGDEFVIVGAVPAEGRDGVDSLADRVHTAVSDRTVDLGAEGAQHLRCSVGIALSDPAGDTVEDLIRNADAALYEAKRAGRDRISWYDRTGDAGTTGADARGTAGAIS